MRDHDVRLAIDDFGTDRSLIQVANGGPASSRAWAFTSALVELVNSLDLIAVAEGVETTDQARALRATKCPLVQGFYLGRPVRASDVDILLRLD